jgi:hypothetical protein
MIFMGAMSPVVDYVVANQFRAKKMGWRPNKGAIKRMLREFGYQPGDLPDGGKIKMV